MQEDRKDGEERTGDGRKVRLLAAKRLYQVVARRIARMIEENQATPDWHLPSERELAEQLEVSRTVVREAVIALEMRGIVEVRGRAGIIVLPAHVNALSFDALNTDIGPGPFELLEARLALETSAAAFAAERATRYDIMELEECIERMQLETDEVAVNEKGDREFHLSIANMTGNAIILSMVQALWDQRDSSRMWQRVHRYIHAPRLRALWIGDHYAIVAALKMRNSEAARDAMARHINNVKDELLKADELGQFSSGETDE
ncbi:FadR/GntR family transcriptional regulator [Martelella mangrovi]|uniref:GntR family uxuAB operon transcriptional repressor n=1 Tax=Martelella mangrovi TaxID=1397477 RepID=A0ABV2IGF4_9HYPH